MEIKQEPLAYFIDKYGIDLPDIKSFVSGENYSALMLNDGSIGICGNVDRAVEADLESTQNLDLARIDDRIFTNCYFNAKFNNSGNDSGEDLLKIVDFMHYKQIVMIGNFHPIVAKFQKMEIKSDIFDLKEDSDYLTPMPQQQDYLSKADCVILTATTISNETFLPIINKTAASCDIFLLGPSTPMHSDMLKYRNVKHLFGTAFDKNLEELIKVIAAGKGPRFFLKFGKKTMLLNND